jgi:transcriptional regulator with XRE-family HTH domain
MSDQQLNGLGELIASHMKLTGESYSAIARRAGMPRQTLIALGTRKMRQTPHPGTLAKLAKGLQISPATVNAVAARAAVNAAQDAHLHVIESDPTLMVLVDTVAALSDPERKVVLATAQALRDATNNHDTLTH